MKQFLLDILQIRVLKIQVHSFKPRSFKESDADDYPEIGSKQFTEDDLDDILLKDSKSEQLDEDESIALSASELDNITSDNDDYLYNDEDSFLKANFNLVANQDFPVMILLMLRI